MPPYLLIQAGWKAEGKKIERKSRIAIPEMGTIVFTSKLWQGRNLRCPLP
jgi:hypothetical protein